MKSKNTSTIDMIIVSVLVATTFLPPTMKFHILRIIIVGLFFLIKSHYIDKIFVIWLINIFLAGFSVVIIEKAVIVENLLHEIIRVSFYALVCAVCYKTSVSIKVLYKICIIVLLIHFTIQLTQYTGVNTFNSYIINYYLGGDSNNIHFIQSLGTDYTFRSGSIFINPNVYVCYPSLCAGVFLQYYKERRTVLPLFMILIGFISVVFTGSRMGMATYVLIIMLFICKNSSFNLRITPGKIFVFSLLVIVLLNWNKVMDLTEELRAFDVAEAYDGSLGIKLSGLLAYFSISNPLYWITGSLGSLRCAVHIDMEYGYIVAWHGMIGVYWFYKLLKKIYTNKKETQAILANTCLVTVLLTDIAASIVLNMSVFPFLSVLALTRKEIKE